MFAGKGGSVCVELWWPEEPAWWVGRYGGRQEKRPGEKIGIAVGKAVGFLLIGRLKKYRNIKAETVARVMISAAKADLGIQRIFESDEIAAYPC
ncbi:MAG: hypothetical protein ACM3MK_08110 [Chitinophagales bacterium]